MRVRLPPLAQDDKNMIREGIWERRDPEFLKVLDSTGNREILRKQNQALEKQDEIRRLIGSGNGFTQEEAIVLGVGYTAYEFEALLHNQDRLSTENEAHEAFYKVTSSSTYYGQVAGERLKVEAVLNRCLVGDYVPLKEHLSNFQDPGFKSLIDSIPDKAAPTVLPPPAWAIDNLKLFG